MQTSSALYGVLCASGLVGSGLWIRSAVLRWRFLRQLTASGSDLDARELAAGALSRDVHASATYLLIAIFAAAALIWSAQTAAWVLLGFTISTVVTAWLSRYARRDARLSVQRMVIERRASEVLAQADTAPSRWAERLTPVTLPDTPGYDLATLHQAGTGVMSGDLVDVFVLPSGRVCCVVGDVAGHDVEASITALQTKFILRSYLRRYRDPGQALEELNRQFVDFERPEEFISLFVGVFDTEAETLRYASAGHPPSWLCSDREVQALRSTGPLLMMASDATFISREVPIGRGDVVVMSTDGLSEARRGDEFFGEERVAGLVRKHADLAPQVLCKSLIDAALEFSLTGMSDDVAVLAVKKSK